MKRIYISGPMTGMPNLNFLAFHAEAARLRAMCHEVVNPAEGPLPAGLPWADYMRFDIAALLTCTMVAVLPGWGKSKGARLECSIALELGMTVQAADSVQLAAPAAAVSQDRINVFMGYAADDSCQIQLRARGHHDHAAFLSACERALMDWDERNTSLAGKVVRHEHWRTVAADAETRARGVWDTLHVLSKPGRGAYAVTVLDEWLPLSTRKEIAA